MRRIAIGLQYAGENFVGFQKQPKGVTVQSEVEAALSSVLQEQVKITGSGRTDSGVHAVEQVAHFDTKSKISLDGMVLGANTHLKNVKILWAKEVDKTFNAQKTAKKKTYEYICYVSKIELPLFTGRATRLDKLPNIKAMQQAASYLVGERDFTSFCAAGSALENKVRKVLEIKITKSELLVPIIKFSVTGNGFLYKMVRNIVGTLLEVGSGKRAPEEVKEILDAKNRKLAGKTAPAEGLYLKRVEYK